jgi:Leucine-rich repeat (LRR) protein
MSSSAPSGLAAPAPPRIAAKPAPEQTDTDVAKPPRCMGKVMVSDPALREKLTKVLSLTGPLTGERAAEVRALQLMDSRIEKLEGLECFSELEELGLSNNRVRDLSPLAGLTSLRKLELSRNRILDVSPLRSLTNLETLGLGTNCVTDLQPVAGLSKLRNLGVTFNYVRSIAPLAGMTQLQYVFLSGNYFKGGLTPLASLYELRTLFIDSTGQTDVSALTQLARFDLIVIQRIPLDCDGQAHNIELLEANAKLHGGRVAHDCTALARKARRQGLRDELSMPVVRNQARDERCAAD